MKRYNERITRYLRKIIKEELENTGEDEVTKTVNLSKEVKQLDKIVESLKIISLKVGETYSGASDQLTKFAREIEKIKTKLEEQN